MDEEKNNRIEELRKEYDAITQEQKKEIYKEFEAILKIASKGDMLFSYPEITILVSSRFKLSGICTYLAYMDYRTQLHYKKV